MTEQLTKNIKELESMKEYPKQIFYKGNLDLLKKKKVAIVGSRKPNFYTQEYTKILAKRLSDLDICIVSGGALGVDAIAHKAAGAHNTIMISPSGLNVIYPATNKELILDIWQNGLALSMYENDFKATPYSFVARNEMVVALSDILIVTQADLNSGSLRSVEFALKMNKDIYVLPHRVNESLGTNELLKNNFSKAIYNIDEFVNSFTKGTKKLSKSDAFIEYCKTTPFYDEAFSKYGSKLFEYELSGKIQIINGRVTLIC